MLENIDKKAAEICAVEVSLVISAITASVWYTCLSFQGVFNPFYAAAIFLTKIYDDGKWPFPENFTEFQAMWEKVIQGSEYLPIQPYAATFILLVIGAGTFYFCLLASQGVVPFLTHSYIKARFGSVYYSVYTFNQKRKVIKHNREIKKHHKKNETEQEQQLESLRKAEREHYEQWKKYNKSELTLSEWKSRVLVDKENY